jgi:hypothetical protein
MMRKTEPATRAMGGSSGGTREMEMIGREYF